MCDRSWAAPQKPILNRLKAFGKNTAIIAGVAVLAVLHLCLFRYSRQHKSYWSCRQQLYVTQVFLSPLFYISSFWNLETCSCLFLLSFCVFFSALYLIHPSILFCFSFCFLFCPPLCLFTLFSNLPYCFLFKSAILSFLFSYNSFLSFSSLCSITI